MPVEVDLGMGGAGGAERGVQFENVVNAQKIFWEAPLGKSGGSRVGMVPVPLLVVLSADSLLGLAKAAGKGSGGAVAGTDVAELMQQMSAGVSAGEVKGGRRGEGVAVKFAVMGCVYRALRFVLELCFTYVCAFWGCARPLSLCFPRCL